MATDEKKPTLAEALAKRKTELEVAKEETAVTLRSNEFAAITIPEDLDWRKWPLPVLVKVLASIVQPGRQGEDWRLSPQQALILGVTSYQLGLSPFLGHTYMLQNSFRVNTTFAGKLQWARDHGFRLGTFEHTRVEREWPAGAARPREYLGGNDVGCTSRVRVNDKEVAEYTAWVSEWFMPFNPNWRTRTWHMLMTRADEKNVAFLSGVGVSENPDDRDIEGNLPAPPAPNNVIEVQAQDFQPLPAVEK